jgi:5'-nucleotidase
MKRAAASATLLLLLTAACSDGGSPVIEADGAGTTAVPAASTTTTAAPEPLTILVSNDDGYAAEGIAALVDALEAQPDVEVVVVAPDSDRSGSGGQTTPEGVTATEVTMANGHPATAVSGFPADAVAHGLDALGVAADVVITGTNAGQNLGPVIDLSGTVGAARVAAQRGIPAVAVSTGLGSPAPDHAAAVAALIEWFVEHRDDLEGATQDKVVNINVPTCAVGEVRDVVEVASSTIPFGAESLVADVDCSGTGAPPADDVAAFNAGFGVITLIPAAPA